MLWIGDDMYNYVIKWILFKFIEWEIDWQGRKIWRQHYTIHKSSVVIIKSLSCFFFLNCKKFVGRLQNNRDLSWSTVFLFIGLFRGWCKGWIGSYSPSCIILSLWGWIDQLLNMMVAVYQVGKWVHWFVHLAYGFAYHAYCTNILSYQQVLYQTFILLFSSQYLVILKVSPF